MIKNFILLHGPDDFRIHDRKQFYLKAFTEKYPDGEVEYFEVKREFSELENAVLTPNLFASKRLIITENFWTPDNFETALEYEFFTKVSEVADSCSIIAIEGELDKRTKVTKHLTQNVSTEHFGLLDETQICDWIIRFTESKGGKISQNEARILLNRCGENGWNLSQEIQKCIMTHEEKIITKENIEALTIPHPKVIVWDFLANLSQRKHTQAIEKFRTLIHTGESAHMLFSMIVREIRIHAQIRAGLDQNLSPKSIASQTKLHPFVVQKTCPYTKNFSQPQIAKMYDTLLQIDRKLKSGGITVTTDDQSEFELAIEKFIVEACQKN